MTGPWYQPLTGAEPDVSVMLTAPSLTNLEPRKFSTLLLLTATLPDWSTACVANSTAFPVVGPPPHQRIEPSGCGVGTRSTPFQAPLLPCVLYSTYTRRAVPSVTTVNPAVVPTISPWFVAMNGAVKSVSVGRRVLHDPADLGEQPLRHGAVGLRIAGLARGQQRVLLRALRADRRGDTRQRRRERGIANTRQGRFVPGEVEHRPEVPRRESLVVDRREPRDQHAVGALVRPPASRWVTSTVVPGSIGRYCAVMVWPFTS